jgi:uncharacterized protein YbjQ (UPF0145 family)
VPGIAVRSIVSVNLTVFTRMCEKARRRKSASAFIGTRYNASELMDGASEVLAYGTAVAVSKAS